MEFAAVLSLMLIGSDFNICATAGHQWFPDIAYENSQYYVFWGDHRDGSSISLYGARVTAAGVVVDSNGKLLFSDSVFNVRVDFDGSNFMVVWREDC